jgi:hypothetical protein
MSVAGGPATNDPLGMPLRDVKGRVSASTWATLARELADGQVGQDEGELVDVTAASEEVWPEPLEDAAYYGLAGDFTRLIGKASEADPAAILLHTLIYVGIMVGSQVRARVGLDQHPARLNGLVIGPTGLWGRKGTAESPVRELAIRVDPTFEDRIRSGLVSGEGIVWHVRDQNLNKNDAGVTDKRLISTETEFASVLRAMRREANTTSDMIRKAFDGKPIETLAKNSPARCRTPHVAVLGHITPLELKELVTTTDLTNGLLNRFVWFAVKRSKRLSDPPEPTFNDIVTSLREVFDWCQSPRVLRRDAEAQAYWNTLYDGDLARERPGLVGDALGRMDVLLLRTSVAYAVMDMAECIKCEHIKAAQAVVAYTERTIKWLLGSATGNRHADDAVPFLTQHGRVSRDEVREYFGRNLSAVQLDTVRAVLVKAGLIRVLVSRTGKAGRPPEFWEYTR